MIINQNENLFKHVTVSAGVMNKFTTKYIQHCFHVCMLATQAIVFELGS